MEPEMKYPIIHIYPTIQGQGPRMGTPMILVRTSTPPEFTQFCYQRSTRETPFTLMSPLEILQAILKIHAEGYKTREIFFGGDDPCMIDCTPLFKLLKENNFKVWLDTTGHFPIPTQFVDHLSLGPKPHMKINWEYMEDNANDIRVYYNPEEHELYNSVLQEIVNNQGYRVPIFIAPRVLTQECVDGVINLVMKINHPNVRADIPLFRTLPNFDKNFNKGHECPICHLMDEFQGVSVKSCLEKEVKK